MTEPIVICDDCGRFVELVRINRRLTLTCDCGERRSVKVSQALPDGWQA
ncbi:hypothetical protein HFTV1-gp53 [Haloferax tailed virus 1]|uniref:Uncharacterized protein n=1 Tax=Haloferax tailed virus 1 TaxID=2507575 RepID=A0A410N6T8_HFTV1|nr:hypothetical protein M1M17_gp53 [Haloferax tailed virus 1]QAS68886.1 hypothetical protein HFTV1-gp53 [Haloferax tailed virus 1]